MPPAGASADIRLAVAWHPPARCLRALSGPAGRLLDRRRRRQHSDVSEPAARTSRWFASSILSRRRLMAGFVTWHVIGHQRSFADLPRATARRNLAGPRAAQRAERAGRHSRLRRDRPARCGASRAARLSGHGVEPDGKADVVPGPELPWSRGACRHAWRNRSAGEPAAADATRRRASSTATCSRRMRRGGYLIQVGRGEHLVEEDLLAALESGQLAGAALDVFAAEPLSPTHPFWASSENRRHAA